MNEEQIRQIVREEMRNNYLSGSPDVPPHSHNGTDNLQIPVANLEGANNFFQTGVGKGAKDTQNVYGANSYIAIPVIAGRGIGTSGSFNGGQAPDGTLVFFTGAGGLQLWVSFNTGTGITSWYGVALPLVA